MVADFTHVFWWFPYGLRYLRSLCTDIQVILSDLNAQDIKHSMLHRYWYLLAYPKEGVGMLGDPRPVDMDKENFTCATDMPNGIQAKSDN